MSNTQGPQGNLTRFRVTGLHGSKTADLRFSENCLILVGENGSGKTTLLRMLFELLAGRWEELAKFTFTNLSMTINEQVFQVKRRELLEAYPEGPNPSERETAPNAWHEYERRRFTRNSRISELAVFQDLTGEFETARRKLEERHAEMRKLLPGQILYLPTFRRIERELRNIMEVDEETGRRVRVRPSSKPSDRGYIELVEFGMKDVEVAVEQALIGLKEFARRELNNLTLRYLGDIVNKRYETQPTTQQRTVTPASATQLLERLDERVLSGNDKARLLEVVTVQQSEASEQQRILRHYLGKLQEFQFRLQALERTIVDFTSVCNAYMEDKTFTYDGNTFALTIHLKVNPKKQVRFAELSSGEKQIVSLFSHLHLSGHGPFFVLIDEPEMSLSVPWQRRFLEDIRKANCQGLVAATHSPFVYEVPSLHRFAHALGDFLS